MSKQTIHDPSDLRTYRIELPNLYDDSDLDPYEFRLLAHYKRVGNCWESTKTTAEKCKMSTGQVSQARDRLHDKGFIIIAEELHEKGTLQITVIDRWAENFEKYSKRSQGEQGVHTVNAYRSRGETKKEPSEEVNNNDAWHRELENATGGYMGGAQEFQDLTEAWQKYPDVRRHAEAMRQLQNARSRTVRVYLKAFLTYNPDYVPPSQKPTYSPRGQPRQPAPIPEYTAEQRESRRQWVIARNAAVARGENYPEWNAFQT